MKTHLSVLFVLLAVTLSSRAEVVIYDVPDVITPSAPTWDDLPAIIDEERFPSTVSVGGIWFNVFTGEVQVVEESRPFSATVEDGRYQLRWNTGFIGEPAEVLVQGPTNRNGVLPDLGNPDLSKRPQPRRLPAGFSITVPFQPAPNIQLSGNFGVWEPGDRGLIGLLIFGGFQEGTQIPTFHAGYADISINGDRSVTLHGFAYNTEVGQPITTAFIGEANATRYAQWLNGYPDLTDRSPEANPDGDPFPTLFEMTQRLMQPQRKDLPASDDPESTDPDDTVPTFFRITRETILANDPNVEEPPSVTTDYYIVRADLRGIVFYEDEATWAVEFLKTRGEESFPWTEVVDGVDGQVLLTTPGFNTIEARVPIDPLADRMFVRLTIDTPTGEVVLGGN